VEKEKKEVRKMEEVAGVSNRERVMEKGVSHSPQQQKFSTRKLRLTREQVWI